MRLRKKWWARPELENSEMVQVNPKEHKGRWKEVFGNNNDIYLELGCGKGRFIAKNALLHPEVNYIGIDLKDEVLVFAKRTIEEAGEEANKETTNVRLIPLEIAFIDEVFGQGEISRIYLNFSTPWPKARHNKRRLTHTRFLEKYKGFLKPNSEIWYKTDNKQFFEDSQEYFKESGFSIEYITYDLHKSDFKENIMTEYEEKFSSQGMNIMFLIAKSKV
jgi:tRNA (guanine-N7-)-methyltransferase